MAMVGGLVWLVVFAADLDVGQGQTYASIGDAVQVAAAGDVIRVYPGDYVEDLSLDGSGAQGSPIRIESVEPLQATVRGRIQIDGSDWELADLTIISPPDVDGVQIDGSRILIEGVDLFGGTRDGIDGGGIDVTIRDSLIHDFDAGDSDAHCIVLNPGAENWVIADNALYDCSGDGVQLFSQGAERTIINTTIERNQIYYTGAISRTENAVDVKNADGLVIRSNVMWGFGDNKTLVFQKGPANIEVTCNEMSEGFTGVEFRGEDGGTIESIVFAHNLMVGFEQYALKFDGTVGAEVFNNTFVDIDGDGLRLEEASLQQGVIQNNLWVNATQIESDGEFTADHNGFWMVADNEIGSDSDVADDPMLDANYRLVAGSPLIDAGVDVGLPFGGASPDIGWDEVDGQPCAAAPDPGDDGGSDDTVDDGSDDTADDAGDDDGPPDTADDDGTGADDAPSDGGPADGSSTGSEDGTGGGGASDDGAQGCGCQHRSPPPTALLASLALLAFVRRRGSAA